MRRVKDLTINPMKMRKAMAVDINEFLKKSSDDKSLLSTLTPAQLARMFPDYYKRNLPDQGKKEPGNIPTQQWSPGVSRFAPGNSGSRFGPESSGRPRSATPTAPGIPKQTQQQGEWWEKLKPPGKFQTPSQIEDFDPGNASPQGTWNKPSDIPFQGIPASVRYKNPGASWTRSRDDLYGVQGYGMISGNNRIGRFPTNIHGLASNMDLFSTSNRYLGQTLEKATYTWRGNRPGNVPKFTLSDGTEIDGRTVITPQLTRNPEFMYKVFRSYVQHEAGLRGTISDQEIHEAYRMFSAGGVENYKKLREQEKAALPPLSLYNPEKDNNKQPQKQSKIPEFSSKGMLSPPLTSLPEGVNKGIKEYYEKLPKDQQKSFLESIRGSNISDINKIYQEVNSGKPSTELKLIDRTSEFQGYGGRDKRGTPNYEYIGVHYTAGSTLEFALKRAKSANVGYQYLIDKDGTVHMVQDPRTGYSNHWGGDANIHPHAKNWNSLGVSFVGLNNKDMTPAQREAGLRLLEDLRKKHNIKPENVLGHGEVTVNHRNDDEGYGLLSPFRQLHGLTPQTGNRPNIASQGGINAWNKADYNQTLPRQLSPEEQFKERIGKLKPPSVEGLPEGLSSQVITYYQGLSEEKRQKFLETIKDISPDNINKAYEENKKNQPSSQPIQTSQQIPPLKGNLEGLENHPLFNGVIETQQNVAGIRKLPVKNSLREYLQYAATRTGIQFEISSGGQNKTGPRTGSHRHDIDNPGTIGAADGRFFVMEDGKKRYLSIYNSKDLEQINKFVEYFSSVAPSAGIGTDYMGTGQDRGQLIHLGGPNNKGDAPKNYSGQGYIGDAFNRGIKKYNKEETLKDLEAFRLERQRVLDEHLKKKQTIPILESPVPLDARAPKYEESKKEVSTPPPGQVPAVPSPVPIQRRSITEYANPGREVPTPPPGQVPAVPSSVPTVPAPTQPQQQAQPEAIKPDLPPGSPSTGKPNPDLIPKKQEPIDEFASGGRKQAKGDNATVVSDSGKPLFRMNTEKERAVYQPGSNQINVQPVERTDVSKLKIEKSVSKRKEMDSRPTPQPQQATKTEQPSSDPHYSKTSAMADISNMIAHNPSMNRANQMRQFSVQPNHFTLNSGNIGSLRRR